MTDTKSISGTQFGTWGKESSVHTTLTDIEIKHEV